MPTEILTNDEVNPPERTEVKYPHTLLYRIPPIVSATEYGLPGNPESFFAITTDKEDNPKFERRIRFLDENGNIVLNRTRKDELGPGKPIEFKEDEILEARRWYFEYRNNFPEIYQNRASAINALPEPQNINENLEIIESYLGIKPLE